MRSQMSPAPCVARPGTGVAAARARDLLRRADQLHAEAVGECIPDDKFRAAYLAALRGAATVLALHDKPQRRGRRTRNAWVLLEGVSEGWARWSGEFATYSRRRTAFEAGIASATPAEADGLCQLAGEFLDVVHETVFGLREPGAA
ncbi:SAV_6107 family HEPN domain-containing protein [Hoyosella altamirensis]|uniref:SAV-6107-like HEPN domain-containing protein n=1 Tax=Hoyosella altamirensis TaxID=616997 RepID=A0A839RPF3_9ACTN|nr:SAV_6107 family HEPN domain-containing protein [Hoyosella altamirensis]MBB3038882.1 hypothetical protein [Hoyosella altamirensis]